MRGNILHIILIALAMLLATPGFCQGRKKKDRAFEGVNSRFSELGITIYGNSVIFSSNRRNDILSIYRNQENRYFYNLYISTYKDKKWSKPQILSESLVLNDDVSWPSITADGNTLYFVSTNKNNRDVTGIYVVKRQGANSWGNPEPFRYNNADYNLISPYITPEGNTLYFAANNPEGEGGYDIYFCRKSGNSWAEPQNISHTINTNGDEITPFMHGSGRFYFASTAHDAIGGYDIFYTERIDGEWIKPVPESNFNRRYDEFGYITSAELDTLFYTNNSSGNDDIFRYFASVPTNIECSPQVEESFCYMFEEAGSMDLDTTQLAYEWDFGDGTKQRGLVGKHCFEGPGFYLVQLNVIDTLTKDVYFSQATYDLLIEEVEQPYITMPDTAYAGEQLEFTAENSKIKSFAIQDYFWDFRDGNTNEGIRVRHTFETPGNYYIKLVASGTDANDQQRAKCVEKEITILESVE